MYKNIGNNDFIFITGLFLLHTETNNFMESHGLLWNHHSGIFHGGGSRKSGRYVCGSLFLNSKFFLSYDLLGKYML